MLKATDIVCPVKRQSFANTSLRRKTISYRISDLAADIDGQLKVKVASLVAFFISIDERIDITHIVKLAIFIRGVDASITVTEEFP